MLNIRKGTNGQRNTVESGYIIDTVKGVYVDVSALSDFQFHRYCRQQNSRNRPDLNLRQTMQFNQFYNLGQNLLYIKHIQNVSNIGKLGRIATRTFLNNHFVQIFGPSYAISMLRQSPFIGYNRTDIQREKIAEYGRKRYENALKLGLAPSDNPINDQRFNVNDIAQVLRDRHGIKGVGDTITVGE